MGQDIAFQHGTPVGPEWLQEVNDHKEGKYPDPHTQYLLRIEPFGIKGALYDADNNRLIVTIAKGRASFPGGTVIKTEDSNLYINEPATGTTYYIYLLSDGTFAYDTTGANPGGTAGTILLTTVITGSALVDALTIVEKRPQLDGTASALSAYLAENEENLKQRAVNVKMPPFNAVSNDTDDDYATIQVALDYCYTNNLPIYFPGGTYKVTQKPLFRQGQVILGAGHNISIIKQYGNYSVAGTADPDKNTGASMVTPFCSHVDIRDIQFMQTTNNNGLDLECSLYNKLKRVRVVGTFVRGTGAATGTNGINIHGRSDANYGAHYTAVENCFINNFVYPIRIREKSNDILIQDTAVSQCHDCIHIDHDPNISRPSKVLVLSNSLEQFDNAAIWSDSYGPNNIFAFNRFDTSAAPQGIYLGVNSRDQVCLFNYYAGCAEYIVDLGSNYITERVMDNKTRTITPRSLVVDTIGSLTRLWLNGFFKKIFLERTVEAPVVSTDDIGTIFIAKGISDWNPGHDNGTVKGSAYPVMWDSSSRWKPLAKPRIDVWGDQAPDTAGSSKAYLVGDNCINLTPAEGKPIGWLCVTGGTPGTWKPYGQVGHRENAGTPVGTITPYFVKEELLDATNKIWYKAVGTTNLDWRAMNA